MACPPSHPQEHNLPGSLLEAPPEHAVQEQQDTTLSGFLIPSTHREGGHRAERVKRKEKGAGEPEQHNVRASAPAAAPQSAPAAAQLSSTGHRCSRQKTLLTKPLSENT